MGTLRTFCSVFHEPKTARKIKPISEKERKKSGPCLHTWSSVAVCHSEGCVVWHELWGQWDWVFRLLSRLTETK